jgi:Domain of unknown function (DUF4136)
MLKNTRTLMVAFGIGVVLTLTASTLSAQDVTSNAMPGIDFSKFHTYKWVTIERAKHPNQIVDTQIKTSIDAQLSAKGLTKTDSDNADLDVAYQIATQQQTEWNASGTGDTVGAVWVLPRAQPSQLERSSWTCISRRPSNLSGLAVLPRPSIQAITPKRTRRISTKQWQSC